MVASEYLNFIPFWFKTMAKQAIPSFTIVSFLCKEPPVYGNSPRISDNGFSHAPDEHDEE
jgi:hypothetical protein